MLLAYVVLHMLGNLTAWWGGGGAGGPRIDSYAEWLRTFGEPLLPYGFVLWAVRAILLVAVVLHITGIVQLARRNRAARPKNHPARKIGRSFASRTMLISGPLLAFFIVFHILHFTTLTIDVTPLHHGEVYANLHGAFSKWYFVVLYVLAVGSLALHLRHGAWSALQTWGIDRPTRNRWLRRTATGLAVGVAVGFVSVPVAFWTGALPEPPAHDPVALTVPAVPGPTAAITPGVRP